MARMTIEKRLQQSLPDEVVSVRKGLSYITGRYVKQTLNEVFGEMGWSYDIYDSKLLSIDDESVRWYVRLCLRIHPKADVFVYREGVAIGHGVLQKKNWDTDELEPVSPGRANEVIDFAAAEAVTDALKRAAVSLGPAFGLELYPLVAGGDKKAKTPSKRAPAKTSTAAFKKPAPKKSTAKPKAKPAPKTTEKKATPKRGKRF